MFHPLCAIKTKTIAHRYELKRNFHRVDTGQYSQTATFGPAASFFLSLNRLICRIWGQGRLCLIMGLVWALMAAASAGPCGCHCNKLG